MFFKKLENYILKMEKEIPIELAPHFKYDETTIISSEVANQIYSLFEQLYAIQQMWEKEKDYSRLLKKENLELQDELNHLYSKNNCDDNCNNSNKINYVS